MEYGTAALDAEINRHQLAERIARARTPRISSTAHRQLITRRLGRLVDRLES